MDIAFSDCLSIGGFCYALTLVDRATRYNWTFGLKSLSSDTFFLLFNSSVRQRALLPVVFTVTVTPNFLGQQSLNIPSTIIPRLSLLLLNPNLLKVLSNLIGR
jgi:hypothetical protein